MRKATTTLLAAAMIFAMAGGRVAQAADRAGVALEWSFNPTVNIGGFDLDLSGQEFALSWKVSDTFAVGAFSGSGHLRHEQSYTNDTVTPTVKNNLEFNANTTLSGIRLTTSFPALTFLTAGIEAGALTVGPATYTYFYGDGTVAGPAPEPDFGGGQVFAGATYGMVGLNGRITLLRGESKTVGAEVGVGASLRFVPVNDIALFGTQENVTTKPVTGKTQIKPVTSFNQLALAVTLALTF